MIRGLWDRETVALMLLAAVMPMALAWLWYGGAPAVGRLLLALVVSGLWHMVFMLARAQPPSFAGALTALAVAMLAPDLGLFQLILGISFGAVLAELIFGGWGRNLLNPATVTLAFLGFGFPGMAWPDPALPVAWAAIPAILIGVGLGVMPGRVIAGAGIALALAHWAGVQIPLPMAAIALVLLVADPVSSASTRLGGWLNGTLFGALLALFAQNWQGAAPAQMAVSAALLASLTAPLLDEIAITFWLARRRRRHG